MDSLLNLCPSGFEGEHINVSLALFGSNASNTGPRLEQNNSGTVGMVYGNNSGTFTSQQFVSSNHPANTWKQYVFTYSTTDGSVGYINGSAVGTKSSTLFGGNYANFGVFTLYKDKTLDNVLIPFEI